MFREARKDVEEQLQARKALLAGQSAYVRFSCRSWFGGKEIFTIFEGTSEIQRLVIGRAVTGLPVR
ncbi:hypothetical protein GCM10009550_02220 [Actinocorallia libanotica]|uniref:Acyl-CoA dehydrogenase-like protein n=1 Tax=Actinocorallia libanotica TaxID=46162 RepID=A0ABN1Q1L5_9ACTN